jgi:hypothetical protein
MAKGKATPAPAPAPDSKSENRYARSAKVIIAEGCGITKEELAMKAEMSTATAGHCLEAFKAITEALREAKLLPEKKLPPKAPVVPAEKAGEPEAVVAK